MAVFSGFAHEVSIGRATDADSKKTTSLEVAFDVVQQCYLVTDTPIGHEYDLSDLTGCCTLSEREGERWHHLRTALGM